MHWGDYQKECHRLLNEVFDSKKEGYRWLHETFKVKHFSELDPKKDVVLLRQIYDALFTKEILNNK